MTAEAPIIVGLGQATAGDDGVGLEVARVLAARGVDVRACSDASLVLSLLEAGRQVVLVDAVVGGGPAGSVIRLEPHALGVGPQPLSSHGVGVAEALELARILYGEAALARLAIVGIAIDRPRTVSHELSPAVAAAIEPAAALALALAEGRA